MLHSACDTLHRYLVNCREKEGEGEWKARGQDFYLVGLASFFIAAKLNSIHFGGADVVLTFYLNWRPQQSKYAFKGGDQLTATKRLTSLTLDAR